MDRKRNVRAVSQTVDYTALAALLVAAVGGVIAITMGQLAGGLMLVVLAVLGVPVKVWVIRRRRAFRR